jgi:hypothetical protein
MTEAMIAHGRLAHVVEMSLRPPDGYADDGRSSIRFSEDNGSFTQEFEMVSPLPPPYKTPEATTHPVRQQIQDGGEVRSPTGADSLEGFSRPSSVAAQHSVRDGVDAHMDQLSISSVKTDAIPSSAQHAPLLPGKAGVYRSSSLLSYRRGVRPTVQTSSRSGSSSPSSTSPGSPSKADKLQRRVSESSVRNAVRRLTTLDLFGSAAPRTSSPLAMVRSDKGPSFEAIDDGGAATSERPSSDLAQLRSQTPSSFASSSRDGLTVFRDVRRVRTESSEGSVIDIRSNPPLEDNSEQGGRHTPASDALAHYFEGTLGSDSPSDKGISPNDSGRRSSSSGEHLHLPALFPKRPTSSISSLSSPLRTSIGDEYPIHHLPESQRPVSSPVVPQNPALRDSVISIASPNQFPRPFQHRPAGQFHLPWIHTDTAHPRYTSSSFPPPSTLISTPVSSAFDSSTLSSPSPAESFSAVSGVTLVNPHSSQHVSTKIVHAPSGVVVMLRLPRQISLHELKERVRAKFREVEDLDVSWDGFSASTTSECDSLLLYYRKSCGGPSAPPSPHASRNRIRSESVSSTSTGNDSLHQTFLRINSGDELVHILGSIPVGEKLVLRLVPAVQEGMTEAI